MNIIKKLAVVAACMFTASMAHATPFSYSGAGAGNVDTNPAFTIDLFAADFGTITDVNLDVTITGGHMEDFDVFLSHGGTTVKVHNDLTSPFNHLDNFTMTFDDEAANPWSNAGIDAVNGIGTFQPFSPLSAFDGLDLNGIWTLSILDSYAPNEGNVLVNWTVYGTADVPEPGILSLLGLSMLGLFGARRRKIRHAAV